MVKDSSSTRTVEVKEKTPVMISGPGKMGVLVASKIIRSDDFRLHPFALAEEGETREKIVVEGQEIILLSGEKRRSPKKGYLPENGFVLDFTLPNATLGNVGYYCDFGLNFAMGTTGVELAKATERIKASKIRALIASNMAKQVASLQHTIKNFADGNQEQLEGCPITIEESHQGPDLARPEFKGKADPSGTAIDISKDLGRMKVVGCPFDKKNIMANPDNYKTSFVMIRGRNYQQEVLGVPKEFLDGHGWHTYRLTQNGIVPAFSVFYRVLSDFMARDPVFASYSRVEEQNTIHNLIRRIAPDKNALFETELSYTLESRGKSPVLQLVWKHNINGRGIYGDGALDALRFLRARSEEGHVFTMADTL